MTIEEVKKECNNCEEVKELTKFPLDERKSDGRRGQCKKCLNSKGRERDKKKKEKKEAEALKQKPGKRVVKIPANKQLCNRNGKIIPKTHCVPGCNDACIDCKNKQIKNIQAINTTTPEEDRELNYTSSFGNSGILAADEGNYSV